MPAYRYDPYMYRLHKMKGGSFKDYKDKAHLPLNDLQIQKHLSGQQLVGIYPLLKDNTSWFIAADFDKQNWIEECQKLIEVCNEYGISAYLERSRSGNGGHVWIFFDQPYQAFKSRRILLKLMELAGLFSVLDKNSSFDRLFPNQDYLSGKGFGNLIALPFYKPAVENGHSCFVDPSTEDLKPYPDQNKFLSAIQKTPVDHLDTLYDSLGLSTSTDSTIKKNSSGKLQISLSNALHLNRAGINSSLINFLKEELNFSNSEFFIKKEAGKNTWGTQAYISCIDVTEEEIVIPRGFAGKLIRFCKEQEINYDFHDYRKKLAPVDFIWEVPLRSHQNLAIEVSSRKDFGIISAPPGSGKTVMALKIIASKQQPALIIVHRKQLMEQWIESIQAFLGIPKNEIGKIGQGKAKAGKKISVAMIQSLGKYIDKQQTATFTQSFGTIIIDECHHIPAQTYRKTISKFCSYYQYGLTATPFRKGNDEKLLFAYLGEKIAEIKPQDIEEYKRPRIVIRKTSLDIPFNSKTDSFETLSKILIHDSSRNSLILKDVEAELRLGKKVVIITERKEHIDSLNQYLKQSFESITLSGEDTEANRNLKWKLLQEGNYQVLITTGQFFGEGSDLQNASCLFLAYPFSFKGKLVQYIGRVQRSEKTPVIYDYHDYKIDYLNRLFLKRNRHYRHFDKQATLFDEEMKTSTSQILTIDKKIKVPISDLDFRYGAAAFKYGTSDIETLEFEIENEDLRPEFEVLKTYFSKALKSKYIEVEIYAEFENKVLVAQSAYSHDLEKINQELIESVRFRFVQKDILGKAHSSETDNNLLDLESLQEQNFPLYKSEEELLNELLKNKHLKHFRQIQYLASKHESDILRIRFVLQPFSFVFLLSGRDAYHLVLETLDTEEATYLWHLDKKTGDLKDNLILVDEDLNIIRNKGRQYFLQTSKNNFSRIVHDYSDERKGFVVWKSALEERLY
ncbi:DEAD/DEAH box helicase [Antarcticibacterium flavum]|uniref:DEAD/DEAH box helicase n=2 Tax=Flavobacteriaceae TaxID=49546 RepID=A0A5B7X7H9_9FLAO|nr:restriction endonuclease subunit R [Antarcticibacterium sp. W02-3]QCY71397.1 DEAD/DEAH box helicase [Antarcticibacterium flavum]